MAASLEAFADLLREALARSGAALTARLRIDVTETGRLLIDGAAGTVSVIDDAEPADCILTMPLAVFSRIMAGDLDETTAFLQGEITIDGDAAVAAQLNDVLRAGKA